MTGPLVRAVVAIRRLGPPAWALLAVGAAGTVRGLEVLSGGFLPAGVLPVSTLVAIALAGLASRRVAGLDGIRRVGRLRRALVVGGVGVLAVQFGAHLLQVAAAAPSATLHVEPVNPVTGTGRYVGVYLVVGVALAAVAEEWLFRGLALRAFARRVSVPRANAAQAALFGCWHLAWPLALAVGPLDPPVSLLLLAVGTVLVTGLVGAVFGVFVRATGTLWTPILAHAVHNAAAVFVHVRVGGADRADVLAPALVVGYAALAWLVWRRWG